MQKHHMQELLQRRHEVAAPLADVPKITTTTQSSDVGLALVLSKYHITDTKNLLLVFQIYVPDYLNIDSCNSAMTLSNIILI